MKIHVDLVKKLRLKSGSGILECKKALLSASGDIEKAIIILKKKGYIKAEKKIKNLTSRGIITTYIQNHYAYILELNCETDFVENHIDFLNFSKKIFYTMKNMNITDINILNKTLNSERMLLISKFSENIVIRRCSILTGNMITSYIHMNRIGVLVQTNNAAYSITKKIAMHIAANNPEYLTRDHIPSSVLDKEKKIQLDIAINSGKKMFIANKIVQGKLEKFIQNICLLEQPCVLYPEIIMKDFIQKNNINILNFVRFELGEEI